MSAQLHASTHAGALIPPVPPLDHRRRSRLNPAATVRWSALAHRRLPTTPRWGIRSVDWRRARRAAGGRGERCHRASYGAAACGRATRPKCSWWCCRRAARPGLRCLAREAAWLSWTTPVPGAWRGSWRCRARCPTRTQRRSRRACTGRWGGRRPGSGAARRLRRPVGERTSGRCRRAAHLPRDRAAAGGARGSGRGGRGGRGGAERGDADRAGAAVSDIREGED